MTLAALAVAGWAGAQGPAPSARPPASGSPAVAVVGHLRIGRDELERYVQQVFQLYRDRTQTDMDPRLEPQVRRQALENLIRDRLLTLEARRRGVQVSEAEVEAELRRDPAFQQDGMFNEAKYLGIKAADPEGFARAMNATREALAARRASEHMERETRLDEAALRAELEREMMRATIEYLALQRQHFDGGYREPREQEILASYAAQAERYRRPEQAALSAVIFDRPPADSVAATDAGFRDWEQRMRARADSALRAIRSGATLERIAYANGSTPRRGTLQRDRAPTFWRGGARELAMALGAAPGTILPEPVRAAPGWAIVRVDSVMPTSIAPLKDVAREMRRELREAARRQVEDRQLAALYETLRETLRGNGYRVRYALADAASFPSAEPSPRDLDRFYRAHLADYSSYDRASGTVVETPFAQVREDVRRRWLRERRRELTRAAAERLREVWGRGRRDPGLEHSMAFVREIGPVPADGVADTGAVGTALGEAVARRGGRPGVEVAPLGAGWLVVDLREVVRDYLPTLEQARPLLAERLVAAREEEETAEARALFESDPGAFRAPATLLFSRLVVEPPPVLEVPLTRDEVERYYRSNLNEFTVEELVRVRHVLVSPEGAGPAADADARAKAEALLKRVRSGEDFAALAAEHSDDPATRATGGDVGVFRRGQMREAFERAAFAMRPGDITGPVRTEVGYHILECLEYLPPLIHPIAEVYSNVAYALAMKKSYRMAAERADSLYRTLRSVAHAKQVAQRHGLTIIPTDHVMGNYGLFDDELRPYIRKLETVKPGQLYPGTQLYQGLGYVITWVDGILPPRARAWEDVKGEARERVRRERSRRVLLAKKAELDSMLTAGWSFDSLAVLWGGVERFTEAPAGSELGAMGGKALLDSLVFGHTRAPVLELGQVSEWVEFPGGFSKLRVVERLGPEADELARRSKLRRQRALWRKQNEYFDRLKARYPVEILDGELRATALPEPTES